MRQNALKSIKEALLPGKAYRRRDLAKYSSNLDRCLAQLVKEGALVKIRQGLYACPSTTVFGDAPPDEYQLLKSFLRDEHFVVFNPSVFNALGLGTTQLYNQRIVLNRKRHGEITLGGRKYFFHRRLEVPTKKQVTEEYFVIELLNRLNDLPEDHDAIIANLEKKLPALSSEKLIYAKNHYATYSAQLRFDMIYSQVTHHAS